MPHIKISFTKQVVSTHIICRFRHVVVCLPNLDKENDILVFMAVLQVSSKDEDFLDLSVDVEQNTSITHCLR